MTQIINLVLFFKGLLFGNKKNRSKGGEMKSFIITCILILSLAANWYLLQGTYNATRSVIRIKAQLADYEEVRAERDSLRITNNVLFNVLSTTGKLTAEQQRLLIPELRAPAEPAVPLPKKGKEFSRQPAVLPREVIPEEEKKQANVSGTK